MPKILVFSAHPDDEILGAGASIAKYAAEKKEVISIIFSYGEMSHPWIKKDIITDTRIKESKLAAKIIGSKTIFFGLDEKDMAEKLKTKEVRRRIKDYIKSNGPEKIFTHSSDDPHPLHQAVNSAVLAVADELKCKNIYVFDIWNPLNIKKRQAPRLYVDVSKTFNLKIKALKTFESQKIQMQLPLFWSVYAKAIKAGFESRNRFAEVFYKVR